MTNTDFRDQAVASLKRTKVSYLTWAVNVAAGKYPDPAQTAWGAALDTLARIGDNTVTVQGVAKQGETLRAAVT